MIAVIVRRRFDCVRARHVIVECFSGLQSEAFVEAQTEEDSDDDGSWQCRREHDRARRHLRKTGQLTQDFVKTIINTLVKPLK